MKQALHPDNAWNIYNASNNADSLYACLKPIIDGDSAIDTRFKAAFAGLENAKAQLMDAKEATNPSGETITSRTLSIPQRRHLLNLENSIFSDLTTLVHFSMQETDKARRAAGNNETLEMEAMDFGHTTRRYIEDLSKEMRKIFDALKGQEVSVERG